MARPLSDESFELVGNGLDLGRRLGRGIVEDGQSDGRGAWIGLALRRAGPEDRQAKFGERSRHFLAKARMLGRTRNQEGGASGLHRNLHHIDERDQEH